MKTYKVDKLSKKKIKKMPLLSNPHSIVSKVIENNSAADRRFIPDDASVKIVWNIICREAERAGFLLETVEDPAVIREKLAILRKIIASV